MVTIRLEHRSEAGADAWDEAIRGPRDAMEGVAEVVSEHVAERFATESDPWGAAWAPLRPATVALYLRRGKTPGSRERLARSKFAQVMDGGRRAAVGLRSKAARWFHEGNPSNRMFGKARAPRPAREILPIRGGQQDVPQDLRARLMEAFKEGFRRAVRRS